MTSTRCQQCGFVGWAHLEFCKKCGAPFAQNSSPGAQAPNFAQNSYGAYGDRPQYEPKKGLAIAALVAGLVSFFTMGFLGLTFLVGLILGVVAVVKTTRHPSEYGGRGMAIGGLVASIATFVPFVLIIMAIVVPNFIAAKRAANEGSVLSALRKIHSGEATFQATKGNGSYGSLSQLSAVNIIDPDLSTGVRNGYVFTLTSTLPTSTAYATFSVTAVPVNYPSDGLRSFFIDESGVIRGADRKGLPASAADLPYDANRDDRLAPASRGRQPAYQ